MRPYNSKRYILFFALLLFLVSSCSVIRYTDPDAPKWAVGSLKTDDDTAIRIESVDGKRAAGFLRGESVFEYPSQVNLLPGFHTVVPCYLTLNNTILGPPLTFYVQKENEYIIRHKVKWDKSLRFWVECNGVDVTTDN